MSQFDPFICDPQVEDLIPPDLDSLLAEIREEGIFEYDEWDLDQMSMEACPDAEDRDLLDYDNWEVI